MLSTKMTNVSDQSQMVVYRGTITQAQLVQLHNGSKKLLTFLATCVGDSVS